MTTRLVALLLSLALMPSGALACSIVIQLTLEFPKHSAELDRTQIIHLANWLDKIKDEHEYESAYVEGSASTESMGGKRLAMRRAEATGRALQSLYEGIPIQLKAYTYPPSLQSKPDAGVIQLIISNPPKCGATPIPGFKR
jgi:hypothetical protein